MESHVLESDALTARPVYVPQGQKVCVTNRHLSTASETSLNNSFFPSPPVNVGV